MATEQGNEMQGDKTRGLQKVREGIVVSNKMDKTVVVTSTRRIAHPMYRKFVKKTRKYKAHDEQNACAEGDLVQIVETRPMSKDKRWKVKAILRKAQ